MPYSLPPCPRGGTLRTYGYDVGLAGGDGRPVEDDFRLRIATAAATSAKTTTPAATAPTIINTGISEKLSAEVSVLVSDDTGEAADAGDDVAAVVGKVAAITKGVEVEAVEVSVTETKRH